ncbi:MAG: hypothetical protein KJO55_10025, partial [Gammaproteobacteria bacterium]|nr:hypothetical protein [Gammaproteobacteria bacterium]
MRVWVLVLCILIPFAATAAEVEHCLEIANDKARLACYDKASGRIPTTEVSKPATTPPGPPVVNLPSAPEPAAEPVQPRSVSAAPAPVTPTPPAAAQPAETFGQEQLDADQTREITSRYDGEFTGWTGKTLFRLENGQVWRQSESGRFRANLDRPMVTIE